MLGLSIIRNMQTLKTGKKVICPECGSEMELFGVFESGEWKFCCPKCHRILSKEESRQLGGEDR